MTNTIQDLFAHNRAWAAEMIKQRPGFFTNLTQQQTPSTCGLVVQTVEYQPIKSRV